MIRLSREIRFSLTPEFSETKNSWAGWPASNQIAPHLVLRCIVGGTPDSKTGFLCDVKQLDRLLRGIVVDDLIPNLEELATFETLLQRVFEQANKLWSSTASIEEISLHLSAFHSYTINSKDPAMITLTQQFEFSAAHRLHSPELSDEENRAVYGKCNNENGHGHNYVIEVSVTQNLESSTRKHLDLAQFQKTVNRLIIDRLDHKHLNLDIDYFKTVIPSVENISIAIWNWLDGQFSPAQLSNIRVFETPKTWAEYSG